MLTLACICIGLPTLILAGLLFECYRHHQELDRAKRELTDDRPRRPTP